MGHKKQQHQELNQTKKIEQILQLDNVMGARVYHEHKK